MNNYTLESFIDFCNDMEIATESISPRRIDINFYGQKYNVRIDSNDPVEIKRVIKFVKSKVLNDQNLLSSVYKKYKPHFDNERKSFERISKEEIESMYGDDILPWYYTEECNDPKKIMALFEPYEIIPTKLGMILKLETELMEHGGEIFYRDDKVSSDTTIKKDGSTSNLIYTETVLDNKVDFHNGKFKLKGKPVIFKFEDNIDNSRVDTISNRFIKLLNENFDKLIIDGSKYLSNAFKYVRPEYDHDNLAGKSATEIATIFKKSYCGVNITKECYNDADIYSVFIKFNDSKDKKYFNGAPYIISADYTLKIDGKDTLIFDAAFNKEKHWY